MTTEETRTLMRETTNTVSEAVMFAFKLSHEACQTTDRLKPVEMVLVNLCTLGNFAALLIKLQAKLRKDELIEDIRAPIFDLDTDEDTKRQFMNDLEKFVNKWSGIPSSSAEVN